MLPTDNTRQTKPKNQPKQVPDQPEPDPELKENNSLGNQDPPRRRPSRPTSLLSDVRPLDNVPQSPDSDQRPEDDYDPPWEFGSKSASNLLRSSVNGSVSVPERLSLGPASGQLTSSVTHDKLGSEELSEKGVAVVAPKAMPAKPTGKSKSIFCRSLNF